MKFVPKVQMYSLNGRVCYHFGHPHNKTHVEVMIPLSAAERRFSKKKCHFQIVNPEKLKPIKDNTFAALSRLLEKQS